MFSSNEVQFPPDGETTATNGEKPNMLFVVALMGSLIAAECAALFCLDANQKTEAQQPGTAAKSNAIPTSPMLMFH